MRQSREMTLTDDEIARMWQNCQSAIDKLLFVLAYELGMRVSEIAHLRADWIDFQNHKIHIPPEFSKTANSTRAIPYDFFPRAKTIIESFFALNDDVGLTRQTIYLHVKDIAKKAEIRKKITPHGLRANSAYRLAEKGMGVQAMRQFFGWSRLETANRYIQKSGRAAENELALMRQKGIL